MHFYNGWGYTRRNKGLILAKKKPAWFFELISSVKNIKEAASHFLNSVTVFPLLTRTMLDSIVKSKTLSTKNISQVRTFTNTVFPNHRTKQTHSWSRRRYILAKRSKLYHLSKCQSWMQHDNKRWYGQSHINCKHSALALAFPQAEYHAPSLLRKNVTSKLATIM